MADLIEFLKARLDEDEKIARAADYADGWTLDERADGGPKVGEWHREINYQIWHCDDEQDGCPEIARGWIAEGRHIARHGPARVLREVEAKRAILDVYDLANSTRDIHVDAWLLLKDCVYALAAIWHDHPDFDPSWVVTE